jgi:hypothetical protein
MKIKVTGGPSAADRQIPEQETGPAGPVVIVHYERQ